MLIDVAVNRCLLLSAVLLLVLFGTRIAYADNETGALRVEQVLQQVHALPAESARQKQKRAAIEVALERAKAAQDAGFDDLHDVLLRESLDMLAKPISDRPDPDFSGSLLPNLITPEDNPYLDALYAWAKARLDKEDLKFPKAGEGINPFKGLHRDYGTRDEAAYMNRYFWLATHPESECRDNPGVIAHLLRRAHAYVDAHVTHGIRMTDSTNGHLTNDFFAIGPAIEVMLKTRHAYPDLLLPSDLELWESMVRQTYDFWLDQYNKNQEGIYRMGRYANRDLAVVKILLACGLYLDEQAGIQAARKLVEAQQDNLFPDGAFSYIGTQNESCGYHNACTMFLTRYYHLTGEELALDLLRGSEWYGPLSVEPGNVSDFWRSPSWKHSWNSGFGYGGETVVALTGNPYERAIIDRHLDKRSIAPDHEAAMWYRDDVEARALSDDYVVFDRNILGPRGRFGRFSFAATLRVPNNDEPGNATIMGAMTTEQDIDAYSYPLEAVLANIMPRVFVETTPNDRHKRPDWAYLTCRDHNAASTGRNWSALHSTYQLHSFGSSRKGREVPWQGTQLWLTVEDRLFGLIEVAPLGNQEAFEVAIGATLGYGGHGERRPKGLVTHGEAHWSLGSLNLQFHEHNFESVRVEPTKIRVSPASMILCSSRPDSQAISSKEQTKRSVEQPAVFGPDQPHFALVEVSIACQEQDAEVMRVSEGELRGLVVTLGDRIYAVFANLGREPAAVELSTHGLPVDGAWVHTPRGKNQQKPYLQEGATLTIPSGQHRVVLAGLDPEQGRQLGWETFKQMIEARQGE